MDSPLVEERDGAIFVAGDLTMHHVGEVYPALLAALPRKDAPARLDLSSVGEIDTAGLQILLATDREMLGRSGVLRIVAASQAVLDVLALFRQQHLLAIVPEQSPQ